ncbi:DUF4177 domain-containing protein [Bowmanella dokdonensis]|uniref:DUF4177 domain-containing protein n=1 Tax=Bowmanella dokdonensis TaxID=751969 RepID=A0A939DL93_9ALTE|nr:DUF4177 domain-containing protein [Bowmanella dokdonensis]
MQFEYKTLQQKLPTKGWLSQSLAQQPLESLLNEQGRQGWELVQLDIPRHQGVWGKAEVTAILKRRKA